MWNIFFFCRLSWIFYSRCFVTVWSRVIQFYIAFFFYIYNFYSFYQTFEIIMIIPYWFFLNCFYVNLKEFFYFLNELLLSNRLCVIWISIALLRTIDMSPLYPSMELNFTRWGVLSTKKFQPECVKKESSTERCS